MPVLETKTGSYQQENSLPRKIGGNIIWVVKGREREVPKSELFQNAPDFFNPFLKEPSGPFLFST